MGDLLIFLNDSFHPALQCETPIWVSRAWSTLAHLSPMKRRMPSSSGTGSFFFLFFVGEVFPDDFLLDRFVPRFVLFITPLALSWFGIVASCCGSTCFMRDLLPLWGIHFLHGIWVSTWEQAGGLKGTGPRQSEGFWIARGLKHPNPGTPENEAGDWGHNEGRAGASVATLAAAPTACDSQSWPSF